MDNPVPKAVNDKRLDNSIISEAMQICIVTRDHRRTIDGFIAAGIGPWAIYTMAPPLLTETTFRGAPAKYSMYLALAYSGEMMWEVIEPITGPSIYTEFLDRQGEGVQHVAVACGELSLDERIREFEKRGFANIQSGVINGNVPYAYFATAEATGTIFEVFDIPPSGLPEPDTWIPAPPPA